jgi:hypothetical protein
MLPSQIRLCVCAASASSFSLGNQLPAWQLQLDAGSFQSSLSALVPVPAPPDASTLVPTQHPVGYVASFFTKKRDTEPSVGVQAIDNFPMHL